jgi:hypothetical protein
MYLICFLFACLGIFANTIIRIIRSYLLSNIRTNLHANILFDAKKYMLKQILAPERIFYSYFLILANICFKISVSKQFACKYSHTSKFSLHIASNYMGKPVTGLRPRLMLKFFDNIRFNLPLNICFEAKK